MKINKNELIQAFFDAGWLDIDTGKIIECTEKKKSAEGSYYFDLPAYIVNAPERYIRIPFFDNIQVALDFINTERIPLSKLAEYEIENIDYHNETYVLHSSFEGIKGITDKKLHEFDSRFLCMLEENSDLEDKFMFFSQPMVEMIINKWVKDNGYDLE